jgi:hypothetical protein
MARPLSLNTLTSPANAAGVRAGSASWHETVPCDAAYAHHGKVHSTEMTPITLVLGVVGAQQK